MAVVFKRIQLQVIANTAVAHEHAFATAAMRHLAKWTTNPFGQSDASVASGSHEWHHKVYKQT